MTHTRVYLSLLVAALICLAGCQTAPQNASEVIGQGYAELTSAAHDVVSARASGLISDVQATQLKGQLQQAKDSLDLAAQAYTAGDAAAAQGKAAQAHVVLQVVIAALQAKGVKKHG